MLARLKDVPAEIAEPQWDELHKKSAPKILGIIEHLRGLYIKVGQVASARPDALPSQIVNELSVLQDKVPAKNPDLIRKVVERSLGRPLGAVFAEWDPAPLAAASIGQVHRARLRRPSGGGWGGGDEEEEEEGAEVAVKVMYPEAKKLFRSDLNTMRKFFKLAQPEYVAVLDEIEKQFLTEFDYRAEAQALLDVGKNMQRYAKHVAVPRPVLGLTTDRVLVMEYLPGSKVLVGFRERYLSLFATAAAGGGGEEAAAAAAADMRSPIMTATDIGVLYRAAVRAKTAFHAKRHSKKLMRRLVAVHGHQVLVDGCFNGDPHPGNILLLGDGRLGLVDWGQCKRLSASERKDLAELVLAMADGDRPRIIEKFVEMGFTTKYMDEDVIEAMAHLYFNKDDDEFCGYMSPQLFLESLQKRDPVKTVPDQFVMASRASSLLRGLGYFFGLKVHIAKEWRPIAQAVVDDYYKTHKASSGVAEVAQV